MTTAQLKRRVPRRWAIVSAIIATMLVGGTALAVHDSTGPLELDGNIADASGGGTDWQAIFDASGNQTANVPAGTLDTTGVIRDFVPGATGPDISYHEPSNKDDQAIGPTGATWGCVSVANPTDKTDIVNAYGMAVQGDAGAGDGDTADDQLFYYGVERFDNSGDAFIGLWLFQDDVGCTADGKFVGSKRTGDILILSNFTGGGSTGSIQLFRYTAGTGTNPGTFGSLVTVTGKCENTNTGDLAFPQNDICATINDLNSFQTPWAMEDKEKPGPPSPDAVRTVEPDQFVEGGVNLTDVFAGAGLGAPPCFGSFLAETRSSSSLDATLKDYALGDLSFCDADISITPTETNRVGEQHTFTVEVDQKVGSGEIPATVGDVEYTLTGSNGITEDDIVIDGGTCVNGAGVEDDLDADGKCTIIFHSDVGGVITGHATVAVNVGGQIINRATDGDGNNSEDAVKTYVDATIDITGDGTNRVGADHEFSVLVKADDGSGDGFQPVAGQEVTVHKADALGAASDPSGDQTCTTAANGTCSVEFDSDTTGTTTGTAEADVTVGGLEFTINTADDAAVDGNESVLKTWVDAKLDIEGDGTNRVDDDHDFTVTAWADDGDGNGLHKEGGVEVTVAFAPANGTDDVGDLTCTTEADDTLPAFGTCSVNFTSSKTGTHTGTASADITAGDIIIEANTGDDATTEGSQNAVKTWVDARISIDGDDTNSIEEDHTFTVLLEKDLGDGEGFVPAGGEDVDVTLTNSGGASYILDATLTTCDVGLPANIDADTDTVTGDCDVVFTSNVAGTVNGAATSALSVGGVTINVSTDDTGSTGDAEKVFKDGSVEWLKHDGDANLLGGAEFELCRTHRLDTSTNPDSYVAEASPVCVKFTDNDAPDNDPADGKLAVIDLVLGRYTVEETTPPLGYHIQDPPGAGPFTFPDMTIDAPDVELGTIFVNIKAFRIIVITCDDITDLLVDGTANLDPAGTFDDTQATMSGADFSALGWKDADGTPLTQTDYCNQVGASFGDLPDGTYDATIEVPDRAPLHPALP